MSAAPRSQGRDGGTARGERGPAVEHHQDLWAETLPIRGRSYHLYQTAPGSWVLHLLPDKYGHFLEFQESDIALTLLDQAVEM